MIIQSILFKYLNYVLIDLSKAISLLINKKKEGRKNKIQQTFREYYEDEFLNKLNT